MYRVTAPVKVNRTIVGVQFTDGVGETDDPTALAYFHRHPYNVVAIEDAKDPAGSDDPQDPPADDPEAKDSDRGTDDGNPVTGDKPADTPEPAPDAVPEPEEIQPRTEDAPEEVEPATKVESGEAEATTEQPRRRSRK